MFNLTTFGVTITSIVTQNMELIPCGMVISPLPSFGLEPESDRFADALVAMAPDSLKFHTPKKLIIIIFLLLLSATFPNKFELSFKKVIEYPFLFLLV